MKEPVREQAMRKFTFMVCAAALLALTPAYAQDAVDTAKAKTEGKVVWYTSTPIEQAQKIVGLFKQQTGIEVELFRSGGSAILSRFQQEMTAGRAAADVITHSDPAAANALGKKGFTVPFKPKNFDKVPDAAKAPDGRYGGQRVRRVRGCRGGGGVGAGEDPKTG